MADGSERVIRFTPVLMEPAKKPRLEGGVGYGPKVRQKYEGSDDPLTYRVSSESFRGPSLSATGAPLADPDHAGDRKNPIQKVNADQGLPRLAPAPGSRSGYEDTIFNTWRKDGVVVEGTFLDGSTLAGRLIAFDAYGLILESERGPVVVFKHALARVCARQAGA